MTPPAHDEPLARALRGFGPLGVVAALAIVFVGNAYVIPVAGLLVLAWARVSQTPMPMIAHAAFDQTALALIYWGLEAKVAHLVFN